MEIIIDNNTFLRVGIESASAVSHIFEPQRHDSLWLFRYYLIAILTVLCNYIIYITN